MGEKFNDYKKMPTTQSDFNEFNTPEFKGVGQVHQPVVICMDTSGSMEYTEPKSSKSNIKIAEEQLNLVKDIALDQVDKKAVDICILGFDDDVNVLHDWSPLTSWNEYIPLSSGGCTCLGQVISEAITATRVYRRKAYEKGIQVKRPYIFVFTDGLTTDDMSEASRLCKKYIDAKNVVNLFVIGLPGSDVKEVKALCNNVHVFKTADCVNGLPNSFQFLKDSIVDISSSNLGDTTRTKISGLFIDPKDQSLQQDENGTKFVNPVTEDIDGMVLV
ncbi:MAG: VWA domain-containing protein [Oscillospiraceae bacterium]